MEARNRPKDGLLGPARVIEAGGEPPHPTPLGVMDGGRFRCTGGGGGGLRYVGFRAVGWAWRWGHQRGALGEPLFCGGAVHGVRRRM